MKGTGAKRNICPGSCVSTGAKFPVAPVESAPMSMAFLQQENLLNRRDRMIVETRGAFVKSRWACSSERAPACVQQLMRCQSNSGRAARLS